MNGPPNGLLRHPAFLRLRHDKRPAECERQGLHEAAATEAEADRGAGEEPVAVDEGVPAASAPSPARIRPAKTVTFSNLGKIFWPAERYTKGDLIAYYRALSPWLLPYLRNRPVVMTRFPDGIGGKSFYQKDAPEFAPEWVRTTAIWSEDTQRDIRYFVCEE